MLEPRKLQSAQPRRDACLREGIKRLRAEGRLTLPEILEGAGLQKRTAPDVSNFLNETKSLSEPKKNALRSYVNEKLKNLPGNSYYISSMDYFGVDVHNVNILSTQMVGRYLCYSIPSSYKNYRLGDIIMVSRIDFSFGVSNIIIASELQRHTLNGIVEASQTWKGFVIPQQGTIVLILKEEQSSQPRFILLDNLDRMNNGVAAEFHGFSSTITSLGAHFSRVVLKRELGLDPDYPNMIPRAECNSAILKALLLDNES